MEGNFRKPSLINTFQDTFWNQALLLSSRWTGINQLRAISSLRGAKAHTATLITAHERAQQLTARGRMALGTQGSHTLLNENPWPTEKTIKFLFCNQRWLIIESEERTTFENNSRHSTSGATRSHSRSRGFQTPTIVIEWNNNHLKIFDNSSPPPFYSRPFCPFTCILLPIAS